jgi:hypothetical protein
MWLHNMHEIVDLAVVDQDNCSRSAFMADYLLILNLILDFHLINFHIFSFILVFI